VLWSLLKTGTTERGKEGGGLGEGNWGRWFPPPDGFDGPLEIHPRIEDSS
jgi:hypothetical protein